MNYCQSNQNTHNKIAKLTNEKLAVIFCGPGGTCVDVRFVYSVKRTWSHAESPQSCLGGEDLSSITEKSDTDLVQDE